MDAPILNIGSGIRTAASLEHNVVLVQVVRDGVVVAEKALTLAEAFAFRFDFLQSVAVLADAERREATP